MWWMSISWSNTVNGTLAPPDPLSSSSGSKSQHRTLEAGCITEGKLSVSLNERSATGTQGPKRSKIFFFLPTRKFFSGDDRGWYHANLVCKICRLTSNYNWCFRALTANINEQPATEAQSMLLIILLYKSHQYTKHNWQAIFASNHAKVARLHESFSSWRVGCFNTSDSHQAVLRHVANVSPRWYSIVNVFGYLHLILLPAHQLTWSQMCTLHVWDHGVLGAHFVQLQFGTQQSDATAPIIQHAKFPKMDQGPNPCQSHKNAARQAVPLGAHQMQRDCSPEQKVRNA